MSAFRQMRKLGIASLATISLAATGAAAAQAANTQNATASPAAETGTVTVGDDLYTANYSFKSRFEDGDGTNP